MQMMNVAMQLLQNKGGAPAGADSAAALAAQIPGAAPQWPQAGAPVAAADGSDAAQAALQRCRHDDSGNTERIQSGGPDGLPQPPAAEGVPVDTAAPAAEEPSAAVVSARMGFKPQSAQMGAYAASMGGQPFPFPPWGGMPAGWPPAEMVDPTHDSMLRPPAA